MDCDCPAALTTQLRSSCCLFSLSFLLFLTFERIAVASFGTCHPLFRADGNLVCTSAQLGLRSELTQTPTLQDWTPTATSLQVSPLGFLPASSVSLPVFLSVPPTVLYTRPSLSFSNRLSLCSLLGILFTPRALVIISLVMFTYLLLHPFNR